MTEHRVEKTCPYDIKDVYSVIVDVESYPMFLPWCTDLKIVEKSANEMIADMIVSFKHLMQQYRSKVVYSPPKSGKASVKTHLIKGPFKYINSCWELEKVKNGTKINFFIDFKFKSFLLEKMMGVVFASICRKMVEEFEQRTLEVSNARAKEN